MPSWWKALLIDADSVTQRLKAKSEAKALVGMLLRTSKFFSWSRPPAPSYIENTPDAKKLGLLRPKCSFLPMTRIDQHQPCNGIRKASRQRGQQRLQAQVEVNSECIVHGVTPWRLGSRADRPVWPSSRSRCSFSTSWVASPSHGRQSDGPEDPGKINGWKTIIFAVWINSADMMSSRAFAPNGRNMPPSKKQRRRQWTSETSAPFW